MIDYSHIYTEYAGDMEPMEKFHICLFLLYCQTRNIPLQEIGNAFDEYKLLVDDQDIIGVDNFLQKYPNRRGVVLK